MSSNTHLHLTVASIKVTYVHFDIVLDIPPQRVVYSLNTHYNLLYKNLDSPHFRPCRLDSFDTHPLLPTENNSRSHLYTQLFFLVYQRSPHVSTLSLTISLLRSQDNFHEDSMDLVQLQLSN